MNPARYEFLTFLAAVASLVYELGFGRSKAWPVYALIGGLLASPWATARDRWSRFQRAIGDLTGAPSALANGSKATQPPSASEPGSESPPPSSSLPSGEPDG